MPKSFTLESWYEIRLFLSKHEEAHEKFVRPVYKFFIMYFSSLVFYDDLYEIYEKFKQAF